MITQLTPSSASMRRSTALHSLLVVWWRPRDGMAMTEQELASHLKICRRQIYNWRMSGMIPYFKNGKGGAVPGGGCGGGD